MQKKLRKSQQEIVLAKDADIYCVYRSALHIEHKSFNKFIIPVKQDKYDTLRCKLVTLTTDDSETGTLSVNQMTYEANYRFVLVDVSSDEQWLLVKRLEKQRKEEREREEIESSQQVEEEKPVKRKRGRPKKAR